MESFVPIIVPSMESIGWEAIFQWKWLRENVACDGEGALTLEEYIRVTLAQLEV